MEHPKLEIPEQAIDATVRQAMLQVVDTIYNQMKSLISVPEIRKRSQELIDCEDLRKEMSVRQSFLTMDLYEIQRSNWADILNSYEERLKEVLALRKTEIKASQEKLRLLREVELAEVALHKAKAEENFDIALLRFRKIKGHLFFGALLLVLGIFLGQFIENISHPVQPVKTHTKKHKK